MSARHGQEVSIELPSSADLQAEAAAYRTGGRAWAFAVGSILGVEIAAGESLVKTVALATMMAAGALYSNERRTHLELEAEMLAVDAGQQG